MENEAYLRELALRLLEKWNVFIILTLENEQLKFLINKKTLSNRECFLFNLKFES